MNIELLIALIGAFVTIIVAFLANFLSKKREVNLKELEFKLDRYNDFLSGFAELGSGYKTYEAHNKVANSTNLLNIIASREVLEKAYDLLNYLETHRGEDYSVEKQNQITDSIIIAMRKDLNQEYKNVRDFKFKLISPGINPGDVIQR